MPVIDFPKPINDVIIVMPEPVTEKIGSIYIPEIAQKRRPEDKLIGGTVVAIGSGYTTKKGVRVMPSYSVGDQVWFGEFSGIPYLYEGINLMFMRQEEVVMYIPGKEAHAPA